MGRMWRFSVTLGACNSQTVTTAQEYVLCYLGRGCPYFNALWRCKSVSTCKSWVTYECRFLREIYQHNIRKLP